MAGRQLAQVLVWTEGPTPDAAYIRQVVDAANPDASAAGPGLAVSSEEVAGPWPADLWAYAMPRLRANPEWGDPRRYELAGWAGSDSRSGQRLFVVSLYRLPVPQVVGGPVNAPQPVTGIGYGAPPGGFPAAGPRN